jgi:hypothetical protein
MTSLTKVIFLVGPRISLKSTGQERSNNGVLIVVSDSATDTYGYRNGAGKSRIPFHHFN